MIAASQRGRSHAHVGKPRDDHFKIAFFSETKWYFIALADGAGSAPLSRKGSEIACESVYKYIKDNINTLEESIKNTEKDLNEEDKKNIANSAYLLLSKAAWNAKDDINKEAIKTEKQVRDFSTTLLFLICKKFSFGWFFATFNVGDGAIAILSENDDNNEPISPLINELDEGEYSGQTLFLTMQQVFIKDKLPSRIKFRILKNFKSAILMTDGISDAKFETLENLHSPYKWSNLWDELYATVQLNELNKETPQKLLDWLLFWSPGNHDDRTIAILY